MVIKATAPYPQSGIMPREIDNFLSSLRSDALMKHDFSTVELADIMRVEPQTRDKSLIANFTIVCLDKTSKSSAASAKDKEKEKDSGHKESH